MPERTDSISLQDLVVIDSNPSRQSTYRLDSKSERNFNTLEQFETITEDKNADSDIEPQNTYSNSNNEDFEEDSDQEKFKTYLTSNCTSSDIESDVDRDELKPESPSEDRRFSQHLQTGYINPYASTFGAEETRLKFSLESVQLKDRLGSLVAPHCREEALRQAQPLDNFEHPVISQSAGSSSQCSIPNPKSLQSSPQPVFPSQGQRSRSSLSFSNDDDSSAAVFPRIKEGLYFCHLCSFSGTTQQEFDVHMTVHFEHTCPHCDYKSRTEGRLKRHIKDFHTEDTDGGYGARAMPGRPKVFRCKQCEYSTTDKLEFWTHTRSHIKEDKLLQCPRCPFVTEYKHHLEYHLRNHFGSKPFKCPKCNYACVNKSMLNSHMKSHTNVYQYRCADCVYATKYCHSLKLHLRNYNHKPAAVLNSDGSLPKGIDATASGLSLLAKRGPPRGPRGTKKGKLDPGTSSFLPMPPSPIRLLPEFQGMIPPFWPMLPSQFPGRFPTTLGMGHRFNSSVTGMPFATPIKSEETRSPTRGNPNLNSYKCNFCNFVSSNRDVLTGHVMLIHAHETQVLFSMYGLSSEPQLEDGQIKINPLNLYRSPMKFPRTENLSGNSECFLDIKKEVTEESPNIKGSNEDGPVKETMKSSPYQFLNEKFQADSHVADKGMDILKEMTLKFGSGQVDLKHKLSSNSSSNDFTAADGPLDLTKPRHIMSSSSNQAASAVLNYKKDGDSCGENSVDSNEVISQPNRKRSRKGKAFRLDTLFMKMQEVQKYIYHSDEDSNVDIHEMNTSDLLTTKGDECTEDQAKLEDFISIEEKGLDEIKSPKRIKSDNSQIKKEIIDDKNERQDSSNKIEKVNDKKVHNLLASAVLSIETKDINRADLMYNKESKNSVNDVLNLTSNSETSPPQEFTSPSYQKAIPAVLEHGSGITWKILNNPRIKNPSDILYNCGNGQRWELSPLDKKLWMESPNYINSLQKVEKADFRCPYCQISFGDCIMYSIHMGYHGYKDPYKCNVCGFTGKDRVEFFLHIARDAHN